VANNYGGSAPGGKRAHRAGLNGRATESTRARPGRCPAAGLTRATRLDFRRLTDRPRAPARNLLLEHSTGWGLGTGRSPGGGAVGVVAAVDAAGWDAM